MKRWVWAVLATCAPLLAPHASEAATYSFTGSVDDPGALGLQFQAGDTVQFDLTIDTSQTGTVSFGSTYYTGAPVTGQFDNGYTFHLQPTVRVQPSSDTVTFGGSTFGDASVGPYDPANADFFLYAPISDGSLPNFADLYALSTSTIFTLYFQGPIELGDSQVQGHLTRVATTPIPAALPLLASALGALGIAGWRRSKSRSGMAPAFGGAG